MTALPPDSMRDMRKTAEQASASDEARALWEELRAHSLQIAHFAQLAPEIYTERLESFGHAFALADEWQQQLVRQTLEDICAMTASGLTALQALADQGLDTTAPALALWREFYHGRAAVLNLVFPEQDSSPAA